VLGMTNGTTITASQVIVQPTDGRASATSSAAGVIPFQPGVPSLSKHVGQIPTNYSKGWGTIVSGIRYYTMANGTIYQSCSSPR
jgi:hypothetical protein